MASPPRELTGALSGTPAAIDTHVFLPSCVFHACGLMSSIRSPLAETYAVSSSNRDASICVILHHAEIPGGVMLLQFAPPSRVIHTRPSSVPDQIVVVFLYEAATA